ncbi:MAG: FecCD family ABC transporter permease [Phycisphaerales bacterium]
MRIRSAIILGLLAIALAGAVLWRLAVGGGGLAFADDPAIGVIRWLRVVSGAGVGASLAVAGVMLQSLLRNPLASPDLLGLSAGASLAIMIAAYTGYRATGSLVPVAEPLPAVAGSLGALVLVYTASQRRGFLDPVTLILVGVIAGIIFGSAASLVRQLLPDGGFQASRLLLGRLTDDTPWSLAWAVLAGACAGVVIGLWLGPRMDAASMSDDEAASVGVPIGALRAWLFVTSGVLTALTVVVAGPIGFVGLVVPHACRMLLGPAHRVVIAASALLGAAAIVAGDALVRSIDLPTGRLPVGVITALVGGPVFILMLRSMMRRGGAGTV